MYSDPEDDFRPDSFPPVYLPPVRVLLNPSGERDDHQLSALNNNLPPPFEITHYNHLSPPSDRSGGDMYQDNSDQQQQQGGMSLNVHLAVPATTAGNDGSHTPNTPEILNSIVNMTHGPFAAYGTAAGAASGAATGDGGSGMPQQQPMQTTGGNVDQRVRDKRPV